MKKTLPAAAIGCFAAACGASTSTPNLDVGDAGGDASYRFDGAVPPSGSDGGDELGSPDEGTDVATANVSPDSAVGGEGGVAREAGGGPNCGNGTLDPGEQCDDGNRYNLDGCDSACRFELVTRMTLLSIQGTAAPSFCTPTTNRFGTQSVTSTGLSQLNPSVQGDVTNGRTNTFIQFLGLGDPSGASNASGLSLGLLSGQLDMAKGAWPGNSPIDWWFLTDHATVGSAGEPTSVLGNGVLAANRLTAGPSDVDLPLPLGGTAALLRVRDARLATTINANPAPDVPAPPPSQLAAGLNVFQTINGDGTDEGLCGNMTVESLARTPIPHVLTTGNTACSALCVASNSYTDCGANNPVGPGCNSWLDVLVGGCSVSALCVPVVNPQQPDVPSATTAQPLTLGTGNKVPTAQSMNNNDAYSAYMKVNLNRVHFTGETCAQTTDCQTGKTCVSAICQ
jgi:cysteine-rich repeat protein